MGGEFTYYIKIVFACCQNISLKMKTPIVSMPNYATQSHIWETFGAFFFPPECFGVL